MESLVARAGAVAAVLAVGLLWAERSLFANATSRDILVVGGLALALATILTAIVTSNVIVPSLEERSADTADVLHAVAHGDLTREPREHDRDASTLGNARVTSAVRGALSALRGAVGEVRSATMELSSRVQDLTMQCTTAVSVAQRGTETASSVSHQSAALVELAKSAHEDVSRVAAGAAHIVDEARAQRTREARLRALSQESLSRLQAGTQALDALSSDVSVGADELGMLAGASEEIRSFVTLVRKMARQSKLLALNAAMEAARAGEHGSGFAVVASEVRRLARSSNEAADRTDALVSDVLERIERVREASARAVDSVRVVRDSTSGGFATLQSLEHEAAESAISSGAGEDAVVGVTAASDALVLRLEQVAREADSLAHSLREASSATSAQQERLQEIAAATNGLARATSRAMVVVNGFRTAREESLLSPPASPSPVPPQPGLATG